MFMKNQETIESDEMSNITNEQITRYIRGIIPESEEIFKTMEKYALKNNVPIVEPEVAQFITVLIKMCKPEKILELGTAIGYSALLMASSFHGSDITTIERNEDMIKIAQDNISNSKYQNRISIINGDAKEILPKLTEKYDFIFLDAAKGQYLEFFKYSSKLLKNDGIILSDNVLFKGMVASNDLVVKRKKTIVKRLRTYLEYINNIDGYTSSILPVGDGVAITYKD